MISSSGVFPIGDQQQRVTVHALDLGATGVVPGRLAGQVPEHGFSPPGLRATALVIRVAFAWRSPWKVGAKKHPANQGLARHRCSA
ncbi:hypothetical protein [Paracoccus sp. (in: a-proteobacteria)]|uniref:hypothetical protein n=1 Tax=Paracoccus sp. TaxID=267 RepID=UPI0035B43900